MLSKVMIIVRREYLERVSKKSFIFTTLLMPLLMLAMMVVPVLITELSEGEHRTVLVVDNSGVIAQGLKSTDAVTFRVDSNANWRDSLMAETVDAALIIPADVMSGKSNLQLYNTGASSLAQEQEIASQVDKLIETTRLREYNIDNLDEIISAVQSNVDVETRTFNPDGSEKSSSTMLSYILGMVLAVMLYFIMLLYGQMVMTSIIEEKNNRVLEIVVSSVRPMQLMLGKICGIGLVAVTQILIWAVLIAVMSAVVMPAIIPANIAADVSALNAGVSPDALGTDVGLLQAIQMMGNVGYVLQLFGLLLLFLVGGFMLYAAIYAAIGSAVDNIQDASQLQSIVIFPIIFGFIFGMAAATDPNSQLAFWASMVPFTSPMVMMARIPFGIPAWEIVVSLVVLYASFFAAVWCAGKIYRVGIFMYGKKPTVKELIRWMRYK